MNQSAIKFKRKAEKVLEKSPVVPQRCEQCLSLLGHLADSKSIFVIHFPVRPVGHSRAPRKDPISRVVSLQVGMWGEKTPAVNKIYCIYVFRELN